MRSLIKRRRSMNSTSGSISQSDCWREGSRTSWLAIHGCEHRHHTKAKSQPPRNVLVLMQLCVIGATAHPHRKINGATIAARNLSRSVAKHLSLDFAVMWDCNEVVQDGPLREEHFRCTSPLDFAGRIVPNQIQILLYNSAIAERITLDRYDLVHLHNLFPPGPAKRIAARCAQVGLSYVISSHGFYEMNRYAQINGFGPVRSLISWTLITRPFRRLVREAAAIFALSDYERDMLESIGVAPERIHVVTNGVNEYYLDKPSDAEIASVRRRFGLDDRPKLFFMGSLHRYKGIEVLRNARNILLIVCGGAGVSYDELRELRKAV